MSMVGNRVMDTIIVVMMPIPAIMPNSCHTFISEKISVNKTNPTTHPPTMIHEPKCCKVSCIDISMFKPCFRFSKKPEISRIQFPRLIKINTIRARIEIILTVLMKILYIPNVHKMPTNNVLMHMNGMLHIRKKKINIKEKLARDNMGIYQNLDVKALY